MPEQVQGVAICNTGSFEPSLGASTFSSEIRPSSRGDEKLRGLEHRALRVEPGVHDLKAKGPRRKVMLEPQ